MQLTFLRNGLITAALAATAAATLSHHGNASSPSEIINLTQTACQFVESEGTDHGFSSTRKSDCEAINSQSGDKRLSEAKILKLKPGKYTFRVTNKNVPYDLGFWLRGDGVVGRVSLPSVSGGGLATGVTKDYIITLKAGVYIYSCPLNPTPDYKIVVEG